MAADFSPELKSELLDDFYAESDEHLGNIRAQLTQLEDPAAHPVRDSVVRESLFRSMHSLKGICAMAGLRVAEQLAHASEGFLRHLPAGVPLATDELDLLVTATQRLEQIIGAHRLRKPSPGADDLLSQLTAATSAASKDDATPAPAKSAPALAADDNAARLMALIADGLAPWRCVFTPSRELDQRGVNINAVRQRLAALGEIVSATPVVRSDGTIAFDFVLGLREPPDDPAAWQADGVTFTAIETTAASSAASGDRAPALSIAPSHIVRVDLSRLDDLMRITGELVIHRSRLEDRINQVADNSELAEVNQALARTLRQLHAAITRVRLVPVAEIFTRMPFVVRDLARETGRRVRLVVEGQDTEIDKYLVERLKEPLLHLVRNAFSHGVEPPAERVAAGKPEEATILLRAATAGEFVLIEIRDDGRGIDPEAVARRAAAMKIDVPETLDDTAMLRLLCTPGFSTREEADRAAGRGVGMAVVHATVRELGGTVALDTAPGRGTQFTLRLPLTLSIAATVIVSAGKHTCAVPQRFIEEILLVPETEVRAIKQAEVIPYRDGVLPLLRLRTMFGDAPTPRPQLSVVVLNSERGSTGLVVDRVHTRREIVVRAMQDPLLQVPGIAGATELGDGRPVLILDPIAITSGIVRPSRAGAARN